MKKEKIKKEKKPMPVETKKTWLTSVTSFVCVIAVSLTANTVIGKLCDAKVEAAKAGVTSTLSENVEAVENNDNFGGSNSENIAEPIQGEVQNDTDQADDIVTNKDGNISVTRTASSGNKATKKSTEKTKSEIVSLYNTAANKIKPNAKSVTRNYSKMQSLPEYLQLPSAINSLGSWAINKFVKGSDEPVTFTSKEDIAANFPVGGESYTSHLTADMVKSASFKDTGKAYEISLVLYNDKITSPKKGTGYAGVFNTVSASTFEEISVPGTKFESVKIKGINGKIQCTVDKATGHITKAVYTNTDVLDLGVKVAGSNMTVKFALTCENSYSIRY